jgi:hypothetical protein
MNKKMKCVVYKIRSDGYYDSGWFEKKLYHSFKLVCYGISDLIWKDLK